MNISISRIYSGQTTTSILERQADQNILLVHLVSRSPVLVAVVVQQPTTGSPPRQPQQQQKQSHKSEMTRRHRLILDDASDSDSDHVDELPNDGHKDDATHTHAVSGAHQSPPTKANVAAQAFITSRLARDAFPRSSSTSSRKSTAAQTTLVRCTGDEDNYDVVPEVVATASVIAASKRLRCRLVIEQKSDLMKLDTLIQNYAGTTIYVLDYNGAMALPTKIHYIVSLCAHNPNIENLIYTYV